MKNRTTAASTSLNHPCRGDCGVQFHAEEELPECMRRQTLRGRLTSAEVPRLQIPEVVLSDAQREYASLVDAVRRGLLPSSFKGHTKCPRVGCTHHESNGDRLSRCIDIVARSQLQAMGFDEVTCYLVSTAAHVAPRIDSGLLFVCSGVYSTVEAAIANCQTRLGRSLPKDVHNEALGECIDAERNAKARLAAAGEISEWRSAGQLEKDTIGSVDNWVGQHVYLSSALRAMQEDRVGSAAAARTTMEILADYKDAVIADLSKLESTIGDAERDAAAGRRLRNAATVMGAKVAGALLLPQIAPALFPGLKRDALMIGQKSWRFYASADAMRKAARTQLRDIADAILPEIAFV